MTTEQWERENPVSYTHLEHFAGHLFDPVVFDDSVKEFLNLKVKDVYKRQLLHNKALRLSGW